MEHQQWRVALGADGRHVDGEDALALELAVFADRLPARGRRDRHVPASLLTTGASVSQASDSIDQ